MQQEGSPCVVLKESQIPAGLCRTLTGSSVSSTNSRSSRWSPSASPRTETADVFARRSHANARERLRVRNMNHMFLLLRHLVPLDCAHHRPSRVTTLRATLRYIRLLQAVLAETTTACSSSPCGV
ncbi:factor in the germline alpha-like [Petromyzon marinus]|uniref:factor in the germline alpha-like n=1 Tax=Petromyzon marinus TaxID=7757 RepID=UPI003F708AA8